MGRVKEMLMELEDEAVNNVHKYEDFASFQLDHPQVDEEVLKEIWENK